MDQIVWRDSYKIGVDFIDREHKMLFSTMNKLLKISENEEKSEWVCREGAKYLRNHTTEHFDHEEEYMRSIGYSEYEVHKRLHDSFRNNTLPAPFKVSLRYVLALPISELFNVSLSIFNFFLVAADIALSAEIIRI